jgi:thiomorpholine-carboxylate dehydrogenase
MVENWLRFAKTMTSPRFFSEDEIRESLTYDALIPAIRRALYDFSAGRVVQPVRTILRVEAHGGWFGVMPAVTDEVFGAKLVTFFPGNAGKMHTHMAMIQLFRSETGEPVAVMDGRLITEMRTAAVSAVATDLLAPRTTPVLAILGSGVQARSHLAALRHVRQFDEVRVWSRTAANAETFAAETGAIVARTAEEAVRGASVVVTVTSATNPILRGEWLGPDTFVNAVGSCTPDRRELDDAAMAARVVVESRAAALRESGDVIQSNATIHAELGELLAHSQGPGPGARFVFKSLGIAVEDIAAAWLVYAKYFQRR